MCFHVLNLCWSNTKRFLCVLVFFGKYFVFAKIVIIFKNSVALFWGLIGWSSRMLQSRAHIEIFRNSLVDQCPSSEKFLEYFSKNWVFIFLAAQYGDLFAGGRSSREGYTEIFTTHLATLSWVEFPITKNT